jgi:hypothetical protein
LLQVNWTNPVFLTGLKANPSVCRPHPLSLEAEKVKVVSDIAQPCAAWRTGSSFAFPAGEFNRYGSLNIH